MKNVIKDLNLHAAPGSDGLTKYFYFKFFDTIGELITEVDQAILLTKWYLHQNLINQIP